MPKGNPIVKLTLDQQKARLEEMKKSKQDCNIRMQQIDLDIYKMSRRIEKAEAAKTEGKPATTKK